MTQWRFQRVSDVKPQVKEDAFDDLLAGSGFTATKKEEARRKLADLKREAQTSELDPEKAKVVDVKFLEDLF